MASKRPPNRIETTPAGVEVAFWDSVGVDGKPQQRRYRAPGVDGEKLHSISSVAGVFDKPALTPAAVKLTEQGVIMLAREGVDIASLEQAELRSQMREWGYHYDSVWGAARSRGDVAHDMLLELVRDGTVPDLSAYDEDIRPWISAGMKWVLDHSPKVLDAEYLVCSLTHGVAGRGDLYCEIDGTRTRVDYKTVTEWKYDDRGELLEPFPENLIQLAGYELAAVESGYAPSERRLVVRLGPDGDYDVTEKDVTEDVFLAALTAYNARRNLSAPVAA